MDVKGVGPSFQQKLLKVEARIDTLPYELLFQIYSYLEFKDLQNLALVNTITGGVTRDNKFLGVKISQKAFKILSLPSDDKEKKTLKTS